MNKVSMNKRKLTFQLFPNVMTQWHLVELHLIYDDGLNIFFFGGYTSFPSFNPLMVIDVLI